MKTIRLNRIAHLAELSAARQWSTLPLRGETLRQALRAVETPAAGVGAVLKPLRLNPKKSLRDISAQRQRLSQALSRAVIRNTGADAARHRQLLKRGAVIRAVDDYVIPHANPLLGSKFREMAARRRVVEFAKANPDGTPKRMVQLKGPAPAKKAKEESWLSRNKWKLAGGAAMIAGLGTYAAYKDRGMKLPYNPHQSVGQEVIGIKPKAAKDWEAAGRRAAKEAKKAGRKAEADVIKAATPPTTAAETRTKQPRTIKPENVQRATDNLWRKVADKKISPKKALAVYARFHGADATKGYDIEAKFRGKNGAELRGRARSQRANWVKKEIGPIAPGATSRKGQGTFAFAAAASRRVVFFNDSDPDQYNQFTPSLYGGTIYRKGRRALVAVKRSGGMAQDIADTAAGKPREPGRKKEWEKSWFKNAVAGTAIGAGIWGTPRLYARAVTNKTHGTIRPGTTWADTIDSVRRGEHRKLFAAVRSRRVVEFLAKDEQRGEKRGSKLNTAIGAAGLLVGGTALAHGIHSAKAMQRNTNAALKAATEAGQSARRVSDEVIPLVKSMHSVVADNAKDIRSGIAASARVANRVDKVTGLPGAMVRAVKQRFARKQLAAVRDRIVNLEDWRLADMRGNSARVFSPKAKRRDRREKTEWEKAATQRKVRNAAIGAAVGLGGLSAYLGFKNMKLRRAAGGAVPKAPPEPAAYSQEFFRNAAGA